MLSFSMWISHCHQSGNCTYLLKFASCVFSHIPQQIILKRKKYLSSFWIPPYQLEPPTNVLKNDEVQEIISNLNPKNSLGYDLITGKLLKGLPVIEIKYHTHSFSALSLKGYFSAQWKVAQIILLLKPEKPPNKPTSSRLISLLPSISKDTTSSREVVCSWPRHGQTFGRYNTGRGCLGICMPLP
jgi:hypothetical protein